MWIGLVVIVALAVTVWKLDKDYNLFGGEGGAGGIATQHCFPLSFDQDATGAYITPPDLVCEKGVWVNKTKLSGNVEVYCDSYYKLVTVKYTDAQPEISVLEAKGNQICENGKIIESPATCGDYVCSGDETEYNCWVDCGVIASWQYMKDYVTSTPSLQPYLQPTDAFDYNYPEISDLDKQVEATKPKTPLQAIKTLTRLITEKVSYAASGTGGVPQGGETADVILVRGTGNCVSYSTVLIAALRHGFYIDGVGRVQIPARQVAGCVSGFGTWKSIEYNVYQDFANLKGVAQGHSWVEVNVGNNRWVMADPTTDTALAKSWFGYHKITTGVDTQIKYIPVESRVFCEQYAETAGD